MKKILALLLVAILALSMVACGAPAATEPATTEPAASEPAATEDPKVTLVYAEVNPLDTIVGQTATAFKEKVEELSNGSITIRERRARRNARRKRFHRHVPHLRFCAYRLRRAEIQAPLHSFHL